MLASLCWATETVLVTTNAAWRYLDNGSDQGTNWIAPTFSDATWSNGPAPLGYGAGDTWIATTVGYGPSSTNKYITTYFRHRFTVADASAYSSLKLRLMRDDGAIVYLNGAEIRRDGMPSGGVNYLTRANQTVSGTDESNYFERVISATALVTGTNVLAVEIHQVLPNSSDIAFALSVIGSDVALPVNLIRQPYLQAATMNSICILAECDSDMPLTVQYGLTTNYGYTARTTFTEATTIGTYVHVVRLTGLQPNTLYHYGVQADNTNWPDATLHTLVPAGTDFRFAWMADCRTGTNIHDTISSAIKDVLPLFSLYGGDLCYYPTYDSFTNEFLRPAELALDATVPFYNTPGNHETWGQNTQAFTENPSFASGTQDFYSFDCGDLHVLVLNYMLDYAPGSAQYSFATNDLAASSKTWKIVTSHEPAYVFGGNHTPSDAIKDLATNCFEKVGVDVMFSGHTHFFEHVLTNNVHYLIVGSAGAELKVPTADPSVVASASSYCYAIADVTYTSLNLVVYNEQGTVLDSISLTKAPQPAMLTVAVQPANAHANTPILPAIQIGILDVKGDPVGNATNVVTLALGNNPGGGTLSGTLSVAAVGGVATFNNVRINQPGQGYTLVASAANLTSTISSGFNIWFADANGNGMADNWETDFFGGTNTVVGAPSADPDGDGVVNRLEFIAGSNPTNAADAFGLSLTNVNGQIAVSFVARQASANYHAGFDRHFSLLATTNLPSGNWNPVLGFEDIVGANQTVTHTNSASVPALFFRAKAWLQPR